MTDLDLMRRAGEKLKKIRVRLGLSIREVERRSMKLVMERQNPDYSLSRASIWDIEKGRFVPGTFKIATLCEVYKLTIADIHAFYGIQPGDITKERPLFAPPKTHLIIPPDESSESPGAAETPDAKLQIENTDLLTRLVDIWGDVPAARLRHLNLRRCLYGYIGTEDKTMSPILAPGTLVRIDPKQTHVKCAPAKRGSSQSPYARPIYFLDVRTGYACGWCQIRDGVLTLIPHPDSGEPTRTFRHPSEVEVVGRVVGIAMDIEEETHAMVEEAMRPKNPPKK